MPIASRAATCRASTAHAVESNQRLELIEHWTRGFATSERAVW